MDVIYSDLKNMQLVWRWFCT